MPQVMSRHAVTVRHLGAGMADYVRRSELHTRTAETLQPARDSEGLVTWDSPHQLRTVMHEHELAQQCLQASMDCSTMRARALAHATAHALWVRARTVPFLLVRTVATLREVAALFTDLPRLCGAPPGNALAVNVLATCQASNAPGLSRVPMTWQVHRT